MKHKLLTLASAAALLAACSDSSVSDANDEIKDKATITFMVVDANTQLPLEDVAVYFRPTDKTKYTDSAGTSVWKDIEIGTKIYWDFQYDGYAMKRFTFTMDETGPNDVARVNDQHPKIAMHELGVDIKGKFYYTDPETGDWIPANGVTVYAKYADDEIYPNEVYTKTDSLGNYSFKNLASNTKIFVKTERFIVDSTSVYEVASIDSVSERKGVVKELNPKAAVLAALDPVLLSSNLNSVGVKDEIKLAFSEVLEKDSVTTNHINVKRIIDDSVDPIVTKDVAVSLSLSEDGKVVTIKSNSGAWADGKEYFINFKVWSKLAKELKDSVVIDGVEYKFKRRFTAGSLDLPGQIKNLVIDVNDDEKKTEKIAYTFTGSYTAETELKGTSDLEYDLGITLKWDGIEKGVDSYNIYVKGDIDIFADYMYVDNTTDTTYTLNLNKLNETNFFPYPITKKLPKVIDVIVLPKNATGEALAKEAKPLQIKTDEKVVEKIKKMQTNDYLKSATVLFETAAAFIAAGGNVYDCASENPTSCVGTELTPGAGVKPTKFYAADLVITNTHKDEYPAAEMPNGYDLYYNSDLKKKDGWVKCASNSTAQFVVYYTDDCSPFKEGAKQYDADGSKVFGFAIVPYFDDGTGYKISQANISDASAGVFINEDNFQKVISKYDTP